MNFFKKTFGQSTSNKSENERRTVSHEYGIDFMRKSREYFEIESVIKKLLRDIKNFTIKWGELISIKAQIYGYLMYFHNNKTKNKSKLIDDLFKFHQKPLDNIVRLLGNEYEIELNGELRKILNIFPQTQREINELKLKKEDYLKKREVFEKENRLSLKNNNINNNKRINYTYLSNLDMKVRNAKFEYHKKYRQIMREFNDKIRNKTSILDKFISNMLRIDHNMFSKLYNVSHILSKQSLIFQYFREYPKGLPAQFKDYNEFEQLQDSSDDDISIDNHDPSKNSQAYIQIINEFVNMGFEIGIIQDILLNKSNKIKTHQDMLNYLIQNNITTKDGILLPKLPTMTMLDEIKEDPHDKPPPSPNSNHKKPMPPSKPKEFLREIKRKSLQRIEVSRRALLLNVETRTSSKSVLVAPRKKPPPPKKKKSFDIHDISGNYAYAKTPEPLIHSETKIDNNNDSNNNDNNNSNDNTFYEHKNISKLIKHVTNTELKTIKPYTRKSDSSFDDIYYYCRSHHPLNIGFSDLSNFRVIHALFNPLQTKNLKDPNSLIQPNSIKTHTLFAKVVNIQNLKFDNSKQIINYKMNPAIRQSSFN